MTSKEDVRHRLAVDIDEELYHKLQKHVPWGTMRHVVIAMLTDFVHLCEKHDSRLIIGAILSEEITLKDFLNKFGDKEDG